MYLLWNRRKTLTGLPDPTRANGTNKPCIIMAVIYLDNRTFIWLHMAYGVTKIQYSLCKIKQQKLNVTENISHEMITKN